MDKQVIIQHLQKHMTPNLKDFHISCMGGLIFLFNKSVDGNQMRKMEKILKNCNFEIHFLFGGTYDERIYQYYLDNFK